MQCFLWNRGEWSTAKGLMQALGLGDREIVSVVGAGGKTSTVCRLAEEYREAGHTCLVMTTTHMLYPAGRTVYSRLPKIGRRAEICWIGRPCEDGRIRPPAEETLCEIFSNDFPVLIEADGARMLPCKAPAEHEPVILRETTHVCGVLGLDALGQRIGACCYRPERVAMLLGKSMEDVLEAEDLAVIAFDERGLRKGVRPACAYTVILNKADDGRRRRQAARAAVLLERRGIGRVVMTCHL